MPLSGGWGEKKRQVLRAVGVVLALVLLAGTAAACTPTPPDYQLRTGDGSECRISIENSGFEHGIEPNTPRSTVSADLDRLIENSDSVDCVTAEFSDRDRATIEAAISDYYPRMEETNNDIVIREQSTAEHTLFRVRSILVNAYPCNCERYEHIDRYDGWTVYESARTCAGGVSCSNAYPPSCLLLLLLITPLVLLAPTLARRGQSGRDWKTGLGTVGFGALGVLSHGIASGIVFALVGASVITVSRNRKVRLSSRRRALLGIVVAGLTLSNMAIFALRPGIALAAIVLESVALVGFDSLSERETDTDQ